MDADDMPATGKVIPLVRGTASLTKLWIELGLTLKNNRPIPNTDTASRLLEKAVPHWKNLHYDTFLQCMMRDINVKVSKRDPIDLMVYLQRNMGVDNISLDTVRQAIDYVGYSHERNCVQDWLNALPPWDGEDRNTTFFKRYYGAPDNSYTRGCGQNFWRGLIARAMKPGCQFDNVIVLEGAEGVFKSKSLEILCPWYAAISADKVDKDFLSAIQGKLLIEIDEMQTFTAASAESVRSTITRRTDRYRKPYERDSDDHPRQCLFVVTLNPGVDFIRDVGGGRRWWPVKCKTVNIELLREHRDQFYAQALAEYKEGQSWWDMPKSETKAEQFLRHQNDPWEQYVRQYVIGRIHGVTINEILMQSELKMEPSRITRVESNRITSILRTMDWSPVSDTQHGKSVKVWCPPAEPMIDDQPSRTPGEDDDKGAPF